MSSSYKESYISVNTQYLSRTAFRLEDYYSRTINSSMHGLRKSISYHRIREKRRSASTETKHSHSEEKSASTSKIRSSLDTLVIPQRTRYPSGKTAIPQQLDVCVAKALLERPSISNDGLDKIQSKSKDLRDSSQQVPVIHVYDETLDQKPEKQTSTRNVSTNSTSISSNFPYSVSSSDFVDTPCVDPNTCTRLFNTLAQVYGLKCIQNELDLTSQHSPKSLPRHKDPEALSDSSHGGKNWLMSKISRATSSVNLKAKDARLVRRESSHSLLGTRRKVSFSEKSFDDIYRLGGVSILRLPRDYAAVPLVVPTCLAATANLLISHGKDTPGIFRIPGQSSAVNELYDYYAARVHRMHLSDNVETTVGSLDLPGGVTFNVHDIASTFKKFIWDFPGGVLGSVSLFATLHEICQLHHLGKCSGFPLELGKLFALALLSQKSKRRIALISAVFGLLAFLKQKPGEMAESSPPQRKGSESMTAKALGVVFAPVLLGNLTENIKIYRRTNSRSSDDDPQASKRRFFGYPKTPKRLKKQSTNKNMETSVERNNECVMVTELLIDVWEEVVHQVSILEAKAIFNKPASTDQIKFQKRPKTWKAPMDTTSLRKSSLGLEERGVSKSEPSPFLVTIDESGTVQPHTPVSSVANGRGVARTSSRALSRGRPEDQFHIQIETPNGRTHVPTSKVGTPSANCVYRAPSTNDSLRPQASTTTLHFLADGNTSTDKFGYDENHQKSCSDAASGREKDSVVSNYNEKAVGEIFVDGADFESQWAEVMSCFASGLGTNFEEGPPKFTDYPFLGEADQTELCRHSGSRTTLHDRNALSQFEEKSTGEGTPADQNSASHKFSLSTDASEEKSFGIKTSISMIPRLASENVSVKRSSNASTAILPKPWSGQSAQSSPCPQAKHHFERVLDKSTPRSNINKTKGRSSTKSAETLNYKIQKLHQQSNEMIHEPPVARKISFKPKPDETKQTSPSPKQQDLSLLSKQRVNVGTLYAEIRRLHSLLGLKREEVWQLKREVEAMKGSKDSGTLSEQLRETEREMVMWRRRAQQAELKLQERNKMRQTGSGK